MIVIGGSLGGMKAVRVILRALPATFSMPVAIVLHRQRDADGLLVHLLQQESALPVSEPLDKEPICPKHIYVAPPDYHLLIEPPNFSLSTDEPVQYARPSIDVLFESAADAFGPAVIGIVLTGANSDGAHGAACIQKKGGTILVQEPSSAESPIMPAAAIESTRTPHIYPPERLAALLLKLTGSPHP